MGIKNILMLKLRNVKVENIMKLYEVFLYKAC